MTMDLYYLPCSAPCRAVTLVASALGIYDKIQLHTIDLMGGQHLNPEFIKLNPQHTVPTLVDNGFALWESRAICRYLVNQYGGAHNSLYPADAKARAVVDQRLDFDMGTLYAKLSGYLMPLIFGGKHEDNVVQKIHDALAVLNMFLEGQAYVAGDSLTIADLSLVATVSTIDMTGVSLKEHPNVIRWYEFLKITAPNYKIANEEPLSELKPLINKK